MITPSSILLILITTYSPLTSVLSLTDQAPETEDHNLQQQQIVECGLPLLPRTISISILPGFVLQFLLINDADFGHDDHTTIVDGNDNGNQLFIVIIMYPNSLIINGDDQNHRYTSLSNGIVLLLNQLLENDSISAKITRHIINWQGHNEGRRARNVNNDYDQSRINIVFGLKPHLYQSNNNDDRSNRFDSILFTFKTNNHRDYRFGIFQNESRKLPGHPQPMKKNRPVFKRFMEHYDHTNHMIFVSTLQSLLSIEFDPNANELLVYEWNYQYQTKHFVGYLCFYNNNGTDAMQQQQWLYLTNQPSPIGTLRYMDYNFDYGFQLYRINNDDGGNQSNSWHVYLVSNRKQLILTFSANVFMNYYQAFVYEFLTFDQLFRCRSNDQWLDFNDDRLQGTSESINNTFLSKLNRYAQRLSPVTTSVPSPSSSASTLLSIFHVLSVNHLENWLKSNNYILWIISMVIIALLLIIFIFIMIGIRTWRLSRSSTLVTNRLMATKPLIPLMDQLLAQTMKMNQYKDTDTTSPTIDVQKSRTLYELWQQQQQQLQQQQQPQRYNSPLQFQS